MLFYFKPTKNFEWFDDIYKFVKNELTLYLLNIFLVCFTFLLIKKAVMYTVYLYICTVGPLLTILEFFTHFCRIVKKLLFVK